MSVSRRRFLRGSLAGSAVMLGLPWLETLAGKGALACAEGLPKCFGLVYWGNGNLPERWTPTEGANWELSDQLQPLQRHKEKLCVVSGMSVKIPNTAPHWSGVVGMLSGGPMSGDEEPLLPTIDQLIAAEIGNDTIYRSLQTASTDNLGLSFNGPGSRNPAEKSPFSLYERLFGSTFVAPGEEGIVDPLLGLRRSVLDGVLEQMGRLKSKVSASDRLRLDQHETGVRELEQRLARLQEDPPSLDACLRPATPSEAYPDVGGRPVLEERTKAMAGLLAMAMACDQTRVFGHYLSYPVNDVLFGDASAGHHDLTHNEPGAQPEVHDITVAMVEQIGFVLDALDGIEEAGGTLLDRCCILATSEVSFGRTHSLDEMPILLAGGACGAVKTNHHYRSLSGENASKVLLTSARAVGANLVSVGAEQGFETNSLSAIEGV